MDTNRKCFQINIFIKHMIWIKFLISLMFFILYLFKNIQDKINLKMKYADIYEEIKTAYYCHKYSEETFLAFKTFLQTLD